jgi:hypothetical protein
MNGTSYFNKTETASALFNYSVDGILFQTTTYAHIVANLTKALPTINCAAGTSCTYPSYCSSIESIFPPIKFQLSDGNYFSVPIQEEATDPITNTVSCTILFGKQPVAGGSYVTLGLPFMKAFMTGYDTQNLAVGIALQWGSQGTVANTF